MYSQALNLLGDCGFDLCLRLERAFPIPMGHVGRVLRCGLRGFGDQPRKLAAAHFRCRRAQVDIQQSTLRIHTYPYGPVVGLGLCFDRQRLIDVGFVLLPLRDNIVDGLFKYLKRLSCRASI